MKFSLIKDERAISFDEYLVITDLHIGYAKLLEEKGYSVPNQTENFVKKIKFLKKKIGAKKLIILGDIKHNVRVDAWEKYDISKFFNEVSKLFEEIIVIKGNHDGKIELMIHPKNVRIKKEFIVDGCGFIHGNSYPSKDFMKKCNVLVMGHIHPVFKTEDSFGKNHYFPCWIIGRLDGKRLKRFKEISIKKVIIVPVFNQMFTGYEKLAGPFEKAINKKEIFLLDLTKVK